MSKISQSSDQSDYFAYLLLITTAILWGISWPLGRWIVSTDYGLTTPPLIIASLRYLFVILGFFPILYLKEKSLSIPLLKYHWKEMTLMSIFSVTIYQFGYLYGEIYTSASDASLVVATGPIWILIISSIVLKETLTRIKIVGAMLGFIGVFLIVGFSPNVNVSDRLLGNTLILLAAISYALYTVFLRRLFNKYKEDNKYGNNIKNKPSSFFVISWVSLIGFIITSPISLVISPNFVDPVNYTTIPDRVWIGIFYLAFLSTIVAYLAYTEGVNRLGAGRAAIFINFVPVVGVALSGLFLSEIIDPLIHLTSLLLITIGIYLVNQKNKKLKLIPSAD